MPSWWSQSRPNTINFARLPRLGLPLLGAFLRHRGYQVRIFCEDLAPLDWSALAGADLVLISTLTCTAPRAYQIARSCRERGIPTIMGGPHVTFLPDEALQSCHIVVRGECETVFNGLIDALEAKELPYGVRGVSFRDGDRVIHNPPAPAVKDLDSLPLPALDLIVGHDRIVPTPIMTSRGCPYDCTFCSVTKMFGHKFRYRSVESVVDEMRFYRPDHVFFYDDIFNASPHRMATLLEAMLKAGLRPDWSAQCHTRLLLRQKDLLPLMRRSGCYALYLGFESVNPDTLLEYNKRQTVEEIREAVASLHQNGILVHGMFVFGADSDGTQTMEETVQFARLHRLDTAQFLILTPLPGTSVYRSLRDEGRLLSCPWDEYDGHHVVFHPRKFTPDQLRHLTLNAMERFYNPFVTVRNFVMTLNFLRTFCKAMALGIGGKVKEAFRLLSRTRETLATFMRFYGWFHLRRLRHGRWERNGLVPTPFDVFRKGP